MNEPVLFIGGGVAALCAARQLQLAGRKVALIDPQPVTGGASFGNGGFISAASFMPGAQPGMLRHVPKWLMDPLGPLAIRPKAVLREWPWFLRWLRAGQKSEALRLAEVIHQLHRAAFTEWQTLLGPELYARHIRLDGEMVLFDSDTPTEMELAERAFDSKFGHEVKFCTKAELQQIYPGLSPLVKRGMLKYGNGHTLSPAGLNLALADLLRRDGARFIAEKAVKIIPQGSRWQVMTNCGLHETGQLVVAAGVWSRDLLAPLGVKVALTSQRGYHAMLPGGAAEIGIPFIHRGRGIGMTAMTEGLRVAGTVEFGGVDGLPDQARVEQALAHARQLFPQMQAEPATFWSGQRPATPDSLPYVGEIKHHPGLWLNFGSGAYGMTQAPPAGRLLADLMLKRPPVLQPGAFAPDRF